LKKLIAILSLFIFLCANTELNQLLKLPILVHHLIDHHNQEPDETFMDFVNEHYSDQQSHSENKDHNNLPFKTTDCSITHSTLAFVNLIPFSISQTIVFHAKTPPIYSNLFYSTSVINNIWQPPKFS
jgi:hypothetical protein